MGASVRARQKKKNRQNRKYIFAAVPIVLIIVVASSAAYLLSPSNDSNINTPTPTPSGLQELADHYMTVMRTLNGTQTKTNMATQLNSHYNQTELFSWQKTKMTFGQSNLGYFEDPMQILNDGKGVCFQWSIVYAAACLSEGYQCRLVASVDTASWNAIHMWTEVYYDGTWVHVDPSDDVWNNPQRYQGPSWSWGQFIGSEVHVYAFQDGSYEDVTGTYAAK
jgi:hypothetical protein